MPQQIQQVDKTWNELQKAIQEVMENKEDAIKYGYEKPVATDPLILGIGGIIVLYLLYRFVWQKFRKKKRTEFNE